MKIRVYLLAFLALAAMFWLEHRAHVERFARVMQPLSEEASVAPAAVDAVETQAESAPAVAAPSKAATAMNDSTSAAPDVRAVEPSVEDLRKEVAVNPHQTPAALVAFASELGDRMVLAETSSEQAIKFFPQLEDCVLNDGPRTTRALCLANAARLAKKFPELRDRAEVLKGRADPEVVRISQ